MCLYIIWKYYLEISVELCSGMDETCYEASCFGKDNAKNAKKLA